MNRLKKISLKNIKIINRTINYEQTFPEIPDISIDSKRCNASIQKGPFYIVFPSPGLYWFELEIESTPDIIIETRQRMLDGREARGWSEYVKEYNCPKLNFLRQPILVLDSVSIYQIKLNRALKSLTWVILILTGVLVLIETIDKLIFR